MASELAAATLVVRTLAPILNDAYVGAKKAIKSRMEGWKAGEDLNKIESYYERLSRVKTIWSRDKALPIEDFYYPSRFESKTARKNVLGLNDLPDGCLVVEGVVGQGKSIFMRYLALSILLDSELNKIPLFVELKNVSEKHTLTMLLYRTLNQIGVDADEAVFDYLVCTGKIVILLDGFDEISNNYSGETIGEIYALQIKYPALKIVVSSRPRNDIQKIAAFTIIKLDRLRKKDHDKFLTKLGVGVVRRAELVAAIQESPEDIQSAISTPLMMSIVVLVYESVHRIPPYLSDFFSVLFHVVFTQHDSVKESFRRKHNTGLSEGRLQHLFEAFCFVVMQKAYGRTLSSKRFDECFEQALKYTSDCKCSSDHFRADIVGVACLMLEEGVGDTTFLHKGILDYFAAAFATRFTDVLAERFYLRACTAYRTWKVSLQFLSKIDTHRHLKYYYLISVSADLSKLAAALESGKDRDLISYVDSLFHEITFIKTDEMSQVEYRSLDNSEVVEEVSDLCRDVLMRNDFSRWTVNHFLTLLDDHPGLHFAVKDSELRFGLNTAMLLYGVDGVRSALKGFQRDLEIRVESAKVLLLDFEQRQDTIEMSFEL